MRCGATRGTKASRCTVLSTTGQPSHQRGLQASGAGGFQQAYPNIRGELGLGHRALSCDNRLSRVGAGSGIDRLSCFACVLCICPPVPYLERGIPQSDRNKRQKSLAAAQCAQQTPKHLQVWNDESAPQARAEHTCPHGASQRADSCHLHSCCSGERQAGHTASTSPRIALTLCCL